MNWNRALRTAVAAAFLASAAQMKAADEYGLSKGETEAAGFVGFADGELTLGGTVGKAVTDKIFVLGDLGYIAGGSASAAGFRTSAHALTFGAGMQYNFRNAFKGNPKFVPYAGAGLSLVRVSASASGGGISASASDSSLMLNLGGGLRYYMTPKWGFRPELMIFAGDGSFVRAAVGIFYQF